MIDKRTRARIRLKIRKACTKKKKKDTDSDSGNSSNAKNDLQAIRIVYAAVTKLDHPVGILGAIALLSDLSFNSI